MFDYCRCVATAPRYEFNPLRVTAGILRKADISRETLCTKVVHTLCAPSAITLSMPEVLRNSESFFR